MTSRHLRDEINNAETATAIAELSAG